MASRRSQSTADLALPRQGGPHRAERVGRTITARRKLAAQKVSSHRDAGPLYIRSNEHDRAQRRLGAARAEQGRARERNEAAVGGSAHLLAAVGLHAADQEVAAREAWLRWVDEDRYRGLNAGPFELLAEGSGQCGRS